MATVFLCATLAPNQSIAQPEESVARFCVSASLIWFTRDEKDVPTYVGSSPSNREMESYWRHSFQGISVPIPMETDGWHFFLGDSHTVKGLAGLYHERLKISYGFGPAAETVAVKGIGEIAAEFGLPVSNLSPIELVRLAMTIDPDEVICNPDDIQSTVNNLSAVYLKALVLSYHDEVYQHEGGVLGHSVFEAGESWTYLFEGIAPDSLYELAVRHESPGRYPYIGFEIADKMLSDSVNSPPWMPVLFETINEPTKDRLLGLRDAIADYSFPEATYESLDERLTQFE